MNASATEPSRYHLQAAVVAITFILSLFTIGTLVAERLESRALHAIAPESFEMKNQGIALQRVAFQQPDLLPLYGSSELMKHVPDKASVFFRHEPTGFEVFPVGKAGTTSLVVLQKLIALGGNLRDRKLVFSLSPSWFTERDVQPRYYAGNFSLEQASAVAFSTSLDPDLRRDIARRLLEFPEQLDKSPVLTFALTRLVNDTWKDRVLYALVSPFGEAEGLLLRTQDHFHTMAFLAQHWKQLNFHPRPAELNWSKLLARAAQDASSYDPTEATEPTWLDHVKAGSDAQYLQRLATSNEWGDLELLLRALQQLGAKPMLLSMPINGAFYDRAHISREARAEYYDRIEALAARYGVPLADFRDHDEDPAFLHDTHDHLSAKGWLYFDAAMDSFFHDQPVRTEFTPRQAME